MNEERTGRAPTGQIDMTDEELPLHHWKMIDPGGPYDIQIPIEERRNTENCLNCYWSKGPDPRPAIKMYACCRFPQYFLMYAEDWCGEWKPQVKKADDPDLGRCEACNCDVPDEDVLSGATHRQCGEPVTYREKP